MNQKRERELILQSNRQSTDVMCLIIFIVFTLAMLLLGLYCYVNGSYKIFNVPFDPDGKGCGTDYPQYPYIYFPSPQLDSLWVTTCVKKCPVQSDKEIDCKTNSIVKSCLENNSADNIVAFHIYDTQLFRGSVCLPTSETIKQRVLDAISANTIEEIFGSVIKDWTLLLLIVPITVVTSLVLILLVRLLAGYVIYVLYFAAIASFLAFGVYLAIPADQNDPNTFILKQKSAVAIAFSVISFILALVVLFLFASYSSKIKAALDYIDKSNMFLMENYSVLILPFILVGSLIIFIMFWVFLTYSFFSMSSVVSEQNQLPFQHFKLPLPIIGLLIISMFYLVWSFFLLMHAGNFVLSGTLVNWVFKKNNPYIKASKIFASSYIGSACLSSFLTSLLGLFKFEVDQAECSTNPAKEQNSCVNFFKKCYGCLCCCCINFLFKCFHHAAFAYINLSGISYCQASTNVYSLIKKQQASWSTVSFLYMIFNEYIPFILTIGHVLLSNVLINNIQFFHDNASNRILLLIVVALISYTILQFFISIYSETIQTYFIIDQYSKGMDKQKYNLDFVPRRQSTPVKITSASPQLIKNN